MKIDHIAVWTADLEKMKNFYVNYFEAVSNEKYNNPKTGLETYFLSFDTGCRIEIMKRPDVVLQPGNYAVPSQGLAHFAFEIKSIHKVNELTELLRQDGFVITGEPRITGDGYYESVVLDPENNIVELIYNTKKTEG